MVGRPYAVSGQASARHLHRRWHSSSMVPSQRCCATEIATWRRVAGLLLLVSVPGLVAGIDGQSNKPSDEEAERIWNDPDCDRTQGSESVDWVEVREVLHSTPFPQTMPAISAIMKKLERVSELDRQVMLCPFGVIAVMFFFVKYLIEGDAPKLEAARVYFSLLDNFYSGMHPSLMDRSDWLVKDSRILALRRSMLNRLRAAHDSDDEQSPSPKVYVYDREVPEVRQLSQGASFCGKGQWGMEVHIHEWLLASPHLTRDPAEADFFFVPAYSICMFEGGFIKLPEMNEVYKSMVRSLPHFKANHGRDHIFTFGSGMSANVFRSWREEIPKSIFLTPETWLFNDFPDITEPCFDTLKDIVIPGYLHTHEILSLAHQARPLAQREHLAVFLGRTDPSRGAHPSGVDVGVDVRGALRKLHTEGKIFVAQNLSIPAMHAVMGNARFCFVPKGKSAWSLRYFEALFANCVPVVLSDHWELPFEALLDVSSFTIKWPMADVGDRLLETLRAVPDAVLERYMSKSRRLRCWYVYPPLLHEQQLGGETDELREVCPGIQKENAFVGILQLLDKKRRASWTMDTFFGPPEVLSEAAAEASLPDAILSEAKAFAEASHSEASD